MPWRYLTILLALLPIAPLQAGTVRAFLDRDTVYEGESVVFTVEADDTPPATQLDVTPLARDFEILDSSRSQRSSMRQGRSHEQVRWLFELAPRHAGTLTIPPLSLGARLTTPRLTLAVLMLPHSAQQGSDILIETSATPRDPYVQSQVRYHERVLLAAGVKLLDSHFSRSAPLRDIVLEPLGDFRESVALRKGRRYRAFERDFALIPERSGTLVVPALELHGQMLDQQASGTSGDQRSRLISVSSVPLKLTVRPRPAGAGGNTWLPSPELSLHGEWTRTPVRFQVGQPVTRILTVAARGLEAAQLPGLQLPALDWANRYPQPATRRTSHTGGWLLGQRRQHVVLVPTRTGTFTLPALRLPWWDTAHDRARVAELPAQTITVLPAAPAPHRNRPVAGAAPATPAPPAARPWYRIGLALVPLGLVILLSGWLGRRRRNPRRQARQRLKAACRGNDPRAAAHALLAWAALEWPAAPSLSALVTRLPAAADVIRDLEQALYAPHPTPWQGAALWTRLRRGPRPAATHELPAPPLPPLYPTQRPMARH